MLKRSLALKIYLYLLVAIVVLGVAGKTAVDVMIRTNQQDVIRQVLETRVRFLASELSRHAPQSPAFQTRLRELETALEWKLRFVPLASSDAPPELAGNDIYFSPQHGRTPLEQRVWARMEQQGRPVGTLEVQFQPPLLKHRPVPIGAIALFLLMLAVLLIPPLTWWVLRPIHRLEQAVENLGAGDLHTRFPRLGDDEIGRLAKAFEAMRGRIAQTIQDKERLLGAVSHELRSPLARMAVAQSLLEEDLGDNRYVAKLRHELAEMDHLVDELLDLARQKDATLKNQPFDLAELIEELLYEREIVLAPYVLDVSLATAPLNGDRDTLKRALGNLLDNALKYTPDGGHIRLAIEPAADHTTVTLTDTGVGIPESALPHLFEPFYRPDTARSRTTGGAGLGLAIAKTIIDRHAGTISLTSQEGNGTTVRVTLPTKTTA